MRARERRVYRMGTRLRQDERFRLTKRRALWAARMIPEPIKASALRGIRWILVESIEYLEDPDVWIQGLTAWRGGPVIYVANDGVDVVGTAIHELTHAILGAIQGERTFVGDPAEHHGETFDVLEEAIRRAYASSGGPPAPRLPPRSSSS